MEIRKRSFSEEAFQGGIHGMRQEQKEDIEQFLAMLHVELDPVKRMFADYECAALEVETKFRVLNTRLSVKGEANPIETIKTRIKSLESILRKMTKLGLPMTMEAVQENIFDIAGVRVICSFIDDIYTIEKYFLDQEDVKLCKAGDPQGLHRESQRERVPEPASHHSDPDLHRKREKRHVCGSAASDDRDGLLGKS